MKEFGFLKTTSSAETFEVPDATSEIKARGFWKAGLEGLPSLEHHCISSLFLMPIPLDTLEGHPQTTTKREKYKIDIKVREKTPQFSLSRTQHEAALKGL